MLNKLCWNDVSVLFAAHVWPCFFATLKSIQEIAVANIIGPSSKIEDLSGSDFGELVIKV